MTSNNAPRLLLLCNTIVEPEGAEAGGHRHALFCLPWFAARFRTAVMVPRFVREHVRSLYLRSLEVHVRTTPGGDALRANRALALILRSITCAIVPYADIYYASSGFLPDVIGPAIRRIFRPRTKLVVVVHHLVDMEGRAAAGETNRLAQAFEALSLWLVRRFATAVIAGNPLVRDQLVGAGIPAQRITVTTNGVHHRAAESTLEGRRREVLFVGRVSLRKGIGDLCHAWQQVAPAHPDWRLVLVGAREPRDAAVLDPLMKRTPGLQYRGRVTEAELAELMQRAALFVMPSYEEGWCIAIAEAMASGLPVLSYDLPIFDLSFDAGRVAVPTGDVQALARSLLHLIEDGAGRAALARDAWRKAQEFDWDRAAQIEAAAFQ